jgi:hypothetical protein
MFEYGEAVLIRPVVHYFGEDEDGDVLLPCRLWCKEVMTFLRTQNVSFVPIPGGRKQKNDEPWIRTWPDSSAPGMFFFQNCSYGYAFYILVCDLIRCTYLDGITHDGLPILDNEA